MRSFPYLCARVVFIIILSSFVTCEASAAESEWTYAVRPGDTLIDIANTYLTHPTSWEKLQKINRVSDPKHLQPGSKLRLPVSLLRREITGAEVVRVQGDVQRTPAASKDASRIETGMQLQVGDTVRTGADSSLTLRFVDGSRLLIAENSRLIMSAMLVYGKTGMADTRLKLQLGAVETQVAPQQGSAAKYEVNAPALHLGVRGTDFRVHVDGTNGTSLSEVLKGKVAATGEQRQVLLNAGFGTLAEVGKPPRPPKALLQAPDTASTAILLEHVPVRFQWSAVTGAHSYHAQVFADRTFDRVILDGLFSANSAKWSDLPDGKYTLRVRAIDSNGLEGLNANHDFTLKARPESPFINGPVGGGKVYGDEAKFSWAKSTIAHAYHLQVSDTPDYSRLLADQRDILANEYSLPLQPGQYYWRIASLMADGDQGPYSDSHSFTQRKIPASPAVEPPKMAGKELSFHWNAGENGERYQFQFAKDNEFKSLLLDTVTPEAQISMSKPGPGSYYMHIKTIDADGFAGPFGQTQVVKIPAPWQLLLLLLPAFLP